MSKIDQLNKNKRHYNLTSNPRNFELFCIKCDKSLGVHDLYYESIESLKYCNECSNKFIKEFPKKISENITILEDYGNDVMIRYEGIRQEFLKQCYFTSKGRYVKIENKRIYI